MVLRIVIIGAGLAGLTAATALRRKGHDVRVYERAAEPREVGAGIGLWPNAVGALRHIGLADAVLARGERMITAEFRLADGRVLSRVPASAFEGAGGEPLALVHRAELLEELLRPLPPEVLHFGRTLTGYEPAAGNGGRVVARFDTGETADADLLLACDGLNSRVRAQLLNDGAPRYAGYTCWRGVVAFPVGPTGPGAVEAGYAGEVWGHGGARFGITRIGGGRVYWWATLNRPPSPGEQGALDDAAKGVLLKSHGAFCAPVPQLIAATDAARIIRNDISDRPPTSRWRDPGARVLLMGDAAHPTTPNYGQGGCMAIEDAAVLGEFLDGAGAGTPERDADLARRLDAFIAFRHPKTARTVRESRWFGVIGQWSSPLLCAGRDTAMRLASPLMVRSVARNIGRLELPRVNLGAAGRAPSAAATQE